jgi:hypothetical protein
VTFPTEYSLAQAFHILSGWIVNRWRWDIIEGRPVILAIRNDKIISQKVKKHVKAGIKFETGEFTLPSLTNSSFELPKIEPENPQRPIPQPAPNPQPPEPDCSKQVKELNECKEELQTDTEYQTHLRKLLEGVRNQLEDSQKENKDLSANLKRTKKELEVSQKEVKRLENEAKDMKEHIDFLEKRLHDIPIPPAPVPAPDNDRNPSTVELSKDQLVALKEKIVEYKKRVFERLGFGPEVDILGSTVRVRFRDKRFTETGTEYYTSHRNTDESKLKEFIDGWAEVMRPYFKK